MKNNEINLLDIENSNDVKGTPTFLKIICILTIAGSVFSIIYTGISFVVIDTLRTNFNNLTGIGDDSVMADIYKWTKISYGLKIIGSLLCILGAIFMLYRRKMGFFSYILGQATSLFASYFTLSTLIKGLITGIGFIPLILSFLITIGFIVMYTVNYKHLNK
jgi:hypothetical protein